MAGKVGKMASVDKNSEGKGSVDKQHLLSIFA